MTKSKTTIREAIIEEVRDSNGLKTHMIVSRVYERDDMDVLRSSIRTVLPALEREGRLRVSKQVMPYTYYIYPQYDE